MIQLFRIILDSDDGLDHHQKDTLVKNSFKKSIQKHIPSLADVMIILILAATTTTTSASSTVTNFVIIIVNIVDIDKQRIKAIDLRFHSHGAHSVLTMDVN